MDKFFFVNCKIPVWRCKVLWRTFTLIIIINNKLLKISPTKWTCYTLVLGRGYTFNKLTTHLTTPQLLTVIMIILQHSHTHTNSSVENSIINQHVHIPVRSPWQQWAYPSSSQRPPGPPGQRGGMSPVSRHLQMPASLLSWQHVTLSTKHNGHVQSGLYLYLHVPGTCICIQYKHTLVDVLADSQCRASANL